MFEGEKPSTDAVDGLLVVVTGSTELRVIAEGLHVRRDCVGSKLGGCSSAASDVGVVAHGSDVSAVVVVFVWAAAAGVELVGSGSG